MCCSSLFGVLRILVGRRWHPCQGHRIRTRYFNKYAIDVAVRWDHFGGLFVYIEPEMTRNRNMSLNTGRSHWNSKVEQNQFYIVTAMNATPLLAEDTCLSALCDVIIFKWWAWHVLNNAKSRTRPRDKDAPSLQWSTFPKTGYTEAQMLG